MSHNRGLILEYNIMKCPVCGATQTEYGAIRDVKHHITNQARKELLESYLLDEGDTPHAKYIKKNYQIERITKVSNNIIITNIGGQNKNSPIRGVN